MHKKERPMLSVTALLYGSNPNANSPTNQLLYNQQQQQQQQSSVGSPSPVLGLTSLSPLPSSNGGNSNGSAAAAGNLTPLPPPTPGPPNTSTSPVSDNQRYPPNHPLSGSKHLCAICEDRASGKHYGVYSCEGCKGFFKRTVRKDLTYICRDDKNCIVDKRQRNRCQYCRYQKCLEMGMKREAVQEERQRTKPDNEVESSIISTTNVSPVSNQLQFLDLTIDKMMATQQAIDIDLNFPDMLAPTKVATKEIELLFRWIRLVPYFNSLPFDDQVVLLKTGWNELMLAEISYRSILKGKRDSLVLANGKTIGLEAAPVLGLTEVYERIIHELIDKMREVEMDKAELGSLRAIVLFNPAIKNLKDSQMIERLRDRVYSMLEAHCKLRRPEQPTRFAKLLVRLPALRSLGLKCPDNLFFKMFQQEAGRKETVDNFITQMLELSMAN